MVNPKGYWPHYPAFTSYTAPPVKSVSPAGASVQPGIPEQPGGVRAFWQRPPEAPLLKKEFISPAGYPLTLFVLPNGHRLMVEQRPSDYMGVRTFVGTGSIVENPVISSPLYGQTGLPSGIAHLDEHAHFLTTRNYPVKNSLINAINQLGTYCNASTDSEYIQHKLFFNREQLPEALRMHAESVLRPIYNADDLLQEKDNVKNEFAFRLGEVNGQLADKFEELMFDRPDRQTIGTLRDVENTTPEDLRRFRQLAYAPPNLLTIVTGNVSPQEVLQSLGPELLSNPVQPSFANNAHVRLALKPGEVRTSTVTDPRLNAGYVHLGFPAPAFSNYRERMALELLGRLMMGNEQWNIGKTLVDEQRVATNFNFRYVPLRQTGSCKFILETPLGKEQEAATALLKQLQTLQHNWISEEQLAQVRQKVIQANRDIFDQTDASSFILGNEAVNNSLPYMLEFEKIANLITPEDIRQVALKYFDPNRYVVVYGRPPMSAQTPTGGSGGQQ